MSKDEDQDHPDKHAAATPAAAKSRKRLVIIGAATALAVLGGGGGAYMMLGGKAKAAAGDHARPAAGDHGGKDDADEAGGEGGEHAEAKPFDVPPILVNLRTSDGAPKFLKVHVMLVPADGVGEETLKDRLPILLDSYQPFLRELRPEDLAGSAAIYRIKEELMLRAAGTLGRDRVKDVLIQDLIQQ